NGLPELTIVINGLSDSLRVAQREGGILNAILNRLSITYIEFYKAYNEVGLAIARGTNLFGLNRDNISEYEDRISSAEEAQSNLIDSIDEYNRRNENINISAPSLPT